MHNFTSMVLQIVIADDEPDLLRYYERLIPLFGHCVAGSACNGVELIERCRECSPDLVITDNRMPKLNGLDAMQRVSTPFVLVTAEEKPAGIEEQFEDRLLAYLVKPIKKSDLADVLDLTTSL